MIYNSALILSCQRELQDVCVEILWHRNVSIPAPKVIIRDFGQDWGRYVSFNNWIEISTHLIIKFEWSSVIEVLKHEIAHFLVEKYFKQIDSSEHGPLFRDACKLLGINAKASCSEGVLRDLGKLSNSDELNSDINKDQKVILKVQKLLELSSSSNENEAMLALQAANRLLLKNQLTHQDIEDEAVDYGFKQIGQVKKRHRLEETVVVNILTEFFMVEAIYVRSYDVKKEKAGTIVEILGASHHLESASYVFDFLNNKSLELWKEYKKYNSLKSEKKKRSFILGFLSGVRKTLLSEENQRVYQLIRKRDKELDTFIRSRHPKLRLAYRKSSNVYQDSYQSGVTQGQNSGIVKGIKQSCRKILSLPFSK